MLKRKSPKEKTKKGIYTKRKSEKKGIYVKERESHDHEWQRIKRDILDPYFYEVGLLNVCELNIPDVCDGMFLNYAHSKKRGDIAKKEPERTKQLCEVVRACQACHHEIEYPTKTEEETTRQIMYRIVTTKIQERNKHFKPLDIPSNIV